MSEAKKQVRSPGHTSGSMRCFYPKEHSSDHHHHADKDCECGMSECLKSGVIYLGHTQKRTVATCAVDCALDCVRARVCKHFVFYEKKSECVHLGKVFGSLSDADAVSGDISCLFPDIHVLPPTTSTPTTLPSTSIVFQTTPSPTTSTPTTLPPTSIAVPTTPAQTTPNSTNELYTSSAASTSNSLYHDRTTKEDYGSPCYQRNTLLEGPTMASLVTSTVARCHQLCFTRPFCEKFSWRWDTKACELKTIATGKTFSETTVSGEMSCFHPEMYTTSPAPSTTTATHTSGFAERCFEKGVRYEGEALLSSDQETLYECADLCLADNYCEVITFFNGRCDLFVSASKAPCPECISAKWTCLQGEVY
ncbi:MAG: uncharacterized protein KVP18_003218 [Porospora cf. gigantea A]|nr:MAG: hypothetical protein KVP18_003218 [Porospora cf. gigantea A]